MTNEGNSGNISRKLIVDVYLLQIPLWFLRIVGLLVSRKMKLEPFLERRQDDLERVGGSKSGQSRGHVFRKSEVTQSPVMFLKLVHPHHVLGRGFSG